MNNAVDKMEDKYNTIKGFILWEFRRHRASLFPPCWARFSLIKDLPWTCSVPDVGEAGRPHVLGLFIYVKPSRCMRF